MADLEIVTRKEVISFFVATEKICLVTNKGSKPSRQAREQMRYEPFYSVFQKVFEKDCQKQTKSWWLIKQQQTLEKR